MPFTALDLDVDRYINPFIPRSRLYLLPKPISWFLGYRSQRRPAVGGVLVWWWSFIGAFCSILAIEAVFQTRSFKVEKTPLVIASLVKSPYFKYKMFLTWSYREQPLSSNSIRSNHLSLNHAIAFLDNFSLHWLELASPNYSSFIRILRIYVGLQVRCLLE